MDWLDRMNGSIGYIEENLDGEIDMDRIARIALCSAYHFQRMFAFLTDISVTEYIRHRRLTLAAQELLNSEIKVIDVAMKYGYDSPVSFARAFNNFHGVNPSMVRRTGIVLKACPRLSFLITIKGDIEMNYRIEDKEAIHVIGKKSLQTLADEQNLKEIPIFWNHCNRDGTMQKLKDISRQSNEKQGMRHQTGRSILGICDNSRNAGDVFDYWIATERLDDLEIPGFEHTVIPSATWAVFESADPSAESMQDLWKRVYTDFFPTSHYEKTKGPDFEVYYVEDEGTKPVRRSEIWIPIKKK